MINRFVTPDARPAVCAAQARVPGKEVLDGIGRIARVSDTGTLLQLLDQATYLTDNILQKTDRASMARSLEVRNPLLDRDVVGIAWRLNNLAHTQPKAPLLRMLERRLPEGLRDGRKKGFSPPMAAWLTGGLRDWADGQLESATRRFDTLLDRGAVMREWHRCQSGSMSKMQAQEFWTLIMLNCVRRP
jgi:asparagine synthase (glutamine-hydrolysing)